MAPKVENDNTTELFVENLAKAGVIPRYAFGVNFNLQDDDSFITFGGFDTDIVPSEDSFVFLDIVDSRYWSASLQTTSYGEKDLGLAATRAILDTGTSLVYFSPEDWDKIYGQISDGRECGYSDNTGFRACTCESENDFEDIVFTMGDYTFKFPVDTYITINYGSPNICEFWIDSIEVDFDEPTVLIGDAFLRNYYILHDGDNMRIGMYSNVEDGDECTDCENDETATVEGESGAFGTDNLFHRVILIITVATYVLIL